MTWVKAYIGNKLYTNIEHNLLRDLIQDLRFNKNNFDHITLYTDLDAIEIIDEIFTLNKFANVSVLFNYGTD